MYWEFINVSVYVYGKGLLVFFIGKCFIKENLMVKWRINILRTSAYLENISL